jgi:hypothetical protein
MSELTNEADNTGRTERGNVLDELYQYLAGDHDRLDRLLSQAVADPAAFGHAAYAAFRTGLLRHISIEEKIVLPAIARFQNGRQAEVAARLRLDHGAIVALLVPPPSPPVVATLVAILQVHNALEEEDGGLYRLLDRLAGAESERLLHLMRTAPEVPVLPFNERSSTLEATRRAVARAGYRFHDDA